MKRNCQHSENERLNCVKYLGFYLPILRSYLLMNIHPFQHSILYFKSLKSEPEVGNIIHVSMLTTITQITRYPPINLILFTHSKEYLVSHSILIGARMDRINVEQSGPMPHRIMVTLVSQDASHEACSLFNHQSKEVPKTSPPFYTNQMQFLNASIT